MASANLRTDEPHWQVSKSSFKDRLLHFHNSDFMSDVTFVVKDARIPAHKVYLAASSPVFDAMFNGPLAPDGKSEITIADCPYEQIFIDFLRYFYVGEASLSTTNMFMILYLAKKYIVPGLEKSCRNFIANNLDEGNVLTALEWLFKLNDEEAKESCMKFIYHTVRYLVKSKEFFQLSLQCLTHILESDYLQIEEIDLFLAVAKWCTEECERRGVSEGSSKTKRAVLADALYLIRFPVMSSKQFVDHCAYSELLSADESRDILCYITHIERQPRPQSAGYQRRKVANFPYNDHSKQSDPTFMHITEKLKFPKEKRKSLEWMQFVSTMDAITSKKLVKKCSWCGSTS